MRHLSFTEWWISNSERRVFVVKANDKKGKEEITFENKELLDAFAYSYDNRKNRTWRYQNGYTKKTGVGEYAGSRV